MKKIILSSVWLLNIATAFAAPVDLHFSIRFKNKLYSKGSIAEIENSMRHAVYLRNVIYMGHDKNYHINIQHIDEEDGIWFRFGKDCEFIYGVDDLYYRLNRAPSRQLEMEVFKDEQGEECFLHMPN